MRRKRRRGEGRLDSCRNTRLTVLTQSERSIKPLYMFFQYISTPCTPLCLRPHRRTLGVTDAHGQQRPKASFSQTSEDKREFLTAFEEVCFFQQQQKKKQMQFERRLEPARLSSRSIRFLHPRYLHVQAANNKRQVATSSITSNRKLTRGSSVKTAVSPQSQLFSRQTVYSQTRDPFRSVLEAHCARSDIAWK